MRVKPNKTIVEKEEVLMEKKFLPPELADEEGIPEAIDALRSAFSDPDLRALIAHREKLLKLEAGRFEIVYREEFIDAFDKTVKDVLKEMKTQGMARSLIYGVRKRAGNHIRCSAGKAGNRESES
jgi:hypothetical protein